VKKWSTAKLVRLAILLALGVILNIVENAINLPLVPGVRLGMTNTIGLIVLFFYGPAEFVILGLLRILLSATYSGFGVSFLLSLSGFVLSSLMVILLYFTKKFSIFGLSLTSAVFHGLGQIIAVSIIYQSSAMFAYFPVIFATGLITGILIAGLSREVLRRLTKMEVGENAT
jgi:heptaprenyl diphosphate synthase